MFRPLSVYSRRPCQRFAHDSLAALSAAMYAGAASLKTLSTYLMTAPLPEIEHNLAPSSAGGAVGAGGPAVPAILSIQDLDVARAARATRIAWGTAGLSRPLPA